MNDVDLRDGDDVTDENDLKDTDSSDTTQVAEDTVTVDLYDAVAGKTPRDGGPYLDQVERHNAETWRAQREDREPDYENPPLTAGSVLVTKSQLVERSTDKSHYSDNVEVTAEPYTTVEVQTPVTEPDPTQPDFDNNYDRLNALNAGIKLDALKQEATDKGGVKAQPDNPAQPVDVSNNPDFVGAPASTGDNTPDYTDPEVKKETDWESPGTTGDTVNH